MSRTARFQNAFLMLVSLLLSVLLWLHVQSQNAPSIALRPFTLKVKQVGLSPELIVVKDPQLVTVSITGIDDAKNIDGEPVASIDLSRAHAGVNSCPVLLEPPPGVAAAQLQVSPKFVKIEIDARTTVSRLVSLKLSGLLSDDLIYNGVTFQPNVVDVSGPKKLVDSVRQVRVIFNLAEAKPGVPQALTVEALDKNDRIVGMVTCEPAAIVARASLLPAPNTKSLIVSPVWRGQPAFGYKIASVEVKPNVVAAKGKSELLSSLAAIETEPVSIEGLQADRTFQVRMIVPGGLTLSVPTTVQIKVKVEKASPENGGLRTDGNG